MAITHAGNTFNYMPIHFLIIKMDIEVSILTGGTSFSQTVISTVHTFCFRIKVRATGEI
jgi:hypothetical protein